VVVATRAYLPPEKDPDRNATGLFRKTIRQELEASSSPLGMETVGVYQIHHWDIHHWDYDTPIEKALRALDNAVRQDNVRYIGAFSI
jgi:Predicted oxidoreductases (related to aryl-alcohol dehydrogenases)